MEPEIQPRSRPRESLGFAAPTLPSVNARDSLDERRRRLTYLILFRVVLISLVLGATTLLYWLSNADLASPATVTLFGIIAGTYLLTVVYSVLLSKDRLLPRLTTLQLIGDLCIATLLVHVTGGAQSAYTFFFPLSIIGAATVSSRTGAIVVALAAISCFIVIGLLGWFEVIPALEGQRIRPQDLSPIELSRAMSLNLAAMIGVSVLAVNLSSQLQQTHQSLATHRSATADLLTLHGDIVRCLSSGLITVSPSNQILTVNDAACDILGIAPEEHLAHSIEETLPGILAKLDALGDTGYLQRGELLIDRESRPNLFLGISVSPLKSAGGQFLGRVINFQDLTELRKMEAHYKQAERLAVIGGLAAGVAHEIRNPLASISGSVELLRGMPQADNDSRTLMDIVMREIDRLNGLLTELLDYTNPRPRKIAQFNLHDLVRDTVRVFSQDRGLKVEVEFADGENETLEMSADPAKLRQVFWNLLRNAAEASGKVGTRIQIKIEPNSDSVVISVKDDGPGISPEHRERIFDPFFTTKTKGHGLGLATVQNIVQEHGGNIRVDSAPGDGATFLLELPRKIRPEFSG